MIAKIILDFNIGVKLFKKPMGGHVQTVGIANFR